MLEPCLAPNAGADAKNDAVFKRNFGEFGELVFSRAGKKAIATSTLEMKSVARDFGLTLELHLHADSSAALGICQRSGIGRIFACSALLRSMCESASSLIDSPRACCRGWAPQPLPHFAMP